MTKPCACGRALNSFAHPAAEPTLPSYIVFDSPPTVQECLASWDEPDPATASERWTSLSTTFASPPPPPPPVVLTAVHETGPAEYDTTLEPDESSYVALNEASVYKNAITFGDEDESTSFQVRGGLDDSQNLPGSCHILPPPSQSQRRGGASQPFPSQHQHANFNESAYSLDPDASEFSLIGTPPVLEWNAHSIRPLDKLREILANAGGNRKPFVSLLAVVIDVRMPSDTTSGKVRAGWDLADKSGALLSLALWDATAINWSNAIRRGDVVFIGDVSLSKYQEKLQATPMDAKSQLQICYRTRAETEEDLLYVFHEEHANLSAAASKVWEQVRWYRKAYSRS